MTEIETAREIQRETHTERERKMETEKETERETEREMSFQHVVKTLYPFVYLSFSEHSSATVLDKKLGM